MGHRGNGIKTRMEQIGGNEINKVIALELK